MREAHQAMLRQTIGLEVNPLPFPVVRKVVEDELLGGLPLEEVFEFFDTEPLGSASIAQVHRAKLRTGREVAVKAIWLGQMLTNHWPKIEKLEFTMNILGPMGPQSLLK